MNHVPEHIVLLLVAFFTNTITPEQHDLLDEWIESDEENQRIFEACLEQSMRPAIYNPEPREEDPEL